MEASPIISRFHLRTIAANQIGFELFFKLHDMIIPTDDYKPNSDTKAVTAAF